MKPSITSTKKDCFAALAMTGLRGGPLPDELILQCDYGEDCFATLTMIESRVLK